MAEFFYMPAEAGISEFDWKASGIRRRRSFAPKTASLWAWYKLGMKMIPEVPNPKRGECQIIEEHADLEKIIFVMRVGDKTAFLGVNRKTRGM